MRQGAAWIVLASVVALGWGREAAAATIEPSANAPRDDHGGPAAAPGAQDAQGLTATTSTPHERKEEEDEGLFGPMRIGAFGGVGFPRPLSIEGFVKVEKSVGFGVEYSVMPKVSFSGTETRFNAIAADVRVFPFENGFFVGLAVGHQHLDTAASVIAPAPYGTITESVSGDTWFVNPRLGFLSTWNWGLTIGVDAGVQLPLNARLDSTLPSGLSLTQGVYDVAHFFTKSALPTVDLLRLGLLF